MRPADAELVKRLDAIVDDFEADANDALASGERSDFWEDVDVPVQVIRDCKSRLESLLAEVGDLKEVLEDKRRLTRELDVALNGVAGAAKQASLCDIVSQVERLSQPSRAVTEEELARVIAQAVFDATDIKLVECDLEKREQFIARAVLSHLSAHVGGARPRVIKLDDALWDALRKRCCATKPFTDAKCAVQVRRDDLVAALKECSPLASPIAREEAEHETPLFDIIEALFLPYDTDADTAMRSALAELRRLRAPHMAWQNISAAPTDGSPFAICREGEGIDTYEVGYYDPYFYTTYEPAEGDLYRKVEVKLGDHRGFNNFHRATHCFLLPPPPICANDKPEIHADDCLKHEDSSRPCSCGGGA